MNISDIGIIFGICTSLTGTGGVALKYYADHEYVLVADSLKGQLYEKQLEIKKLEIKPELTPEEKALKEFLKLQESQILQELQ